jgi:hypothetical protein
MAPAGPTIVREGPMSHNEPAWLSQYLSNDDRKRVESLKYKIG